MGKLLIDDYPLIVLPKLATEIGLNNAMFLQQVHFLTNAKSEKGETRGHFRNGFYWVYNTYDEWRKVFPFWSIPTIRRIVEALEKDKLIFTTNQYNKRRSDKTKWYRVDLDAMALLQDKILKAKACKATDQIDQSQQLPLINLISACDQIDHITSDQIDQSVTREEDFPSENIYSAPLLQGDGINSLLPVLSEIAKETYWGPTQEKFEDASLILFGWDVVPDQIVEFGKLWKLHGWHGGKPSLTNIVDHVREWLDGTWPQTKQKRNGTGSTASSHGATSSYANQLNTVGITNLVRSTAYGTD